MKGLLNLLTVLATLLNLTTGCGLQARGIARRGLLNLGRRLVSQHLNAGSGGPTLETMTAGLGGSSRGTLLTGISSLAGGSLGGGLTSGTGGLSSIGDISGGTLGLQLGQRLQQTHRAAAAGFLVASSTAGSTATGFAARVPSSIRPGAQAQLPGAGIAVVLPSGGGLGGHPAAALPVGVSSSTSVSSSSISVSGTNTVQGSLRPLQQIGHAAGGQSLGALNVAQNTALGTATHIAGSSLRNAMGVTANLVEGGPGGSVPSGDSRLRSNGPGSGIDVVEAVGQPGQQIGHALGGVPLSAAGAAIQTATQIARSSTVNSLGVTANLNGGVSPGGAVSPVMGPGPSGPASGQGASLGAANTVGELRGLIGGAANSLGQGVSSSGTVTSTNNLLSGSAFPAGTNQGQRPEQFGQPGSQQSRGGSYVSSSISHQSSTSMTTHQAERPVGNGQGAGLGAASTVGVLGGLIGAAANGVGQRVSRSGAVSSSNNFLSGTNQGQRPGQDGQQIGQLSGGGSFLAGSATHHSTTSMTTGLAANAVNNGIDVVQAVGQPAQQMGQALGGVPLSAAGAAIQTATQIARSSTVNSLGVAANLNGGGSTGGAVSPGMGPGPSGPASGPGFPTGMNQGLEPGQFGQPIVQQSRGGSYVSSSTSHQSTSSMTTHQTESPVGMITGQAPGISSQPMNQGSGGGSFVATTSSSHTQARWGAQILRNSHGHSGGGGLPSLGNAGPAGGAPNSASGVGLTAGGAGEGLLGTILQAGTERGPVSVPGTLPQGVGGLGSSTGSTTVISGTMQHAPLQKRNGIGAAATAGIVLGTMAGALALGAIGTGIASTLQSGTPGGVRRVGGCGGGGCRSGCGRKRRSLSQSKVPAQVLDNIPMNFNRL